MVQPINYQMDVLNPIEGYMQGLKFGEGILTDRLNRDATTQNMGIQREQMDLAQQQFAAQEQARAQQAAAARQQQEQARAGQAAAMQLYQGMADGTATTAQIEAFNLAFPAYAEQVAAAKANFSEDRVANETQFGQQLAFAITQGNVDAARGLLEERQQAAEAAGDAQGAAVYKAQLLELDEDPNAVKMQSVLALSNLMDKGQFETFGNLIGINAGGDGAGVRASDILEDGTIVQSTDTGPRVYNAQGELVTGQAAADAVAEAQRIRVENESAVAGARVTGANLADIETGGAAEGATALGRLSMEAGVTAFQDIAKVNGSISNINEAITAIDDGAASGIVYNMLPNVTEASASLNNAMNRMGLDVIGSVTFGALSEGEMKLAMETAVPRNLQPAQLREWLVKKRAAQEKAREALQNAASYLTTPGNTINTWLAEQEGSGGEAPTRLRYNPETGEFE